MAAARLTGKLFRMAKRAGQKATGKRKRPPKDKPSDTLEPMDSPDASGDSSGKGGAFGKLIKWKGLGAAIGLKYVIGALTGGDEKPPRGELQRQLKELQADTDSAAVIATERVSGLDRLMRQEREVAAQAPRGTPPATPILDRLGVLMPDLLTQLRQRMKGAGGGLWSELAEGEILVDGASAPSRAQVAAENQQLELTLREELGFSLPGAPRQGANRDVEALLA